MPVTIAVSRIPADGTQRDNLLKLFAHQGYLTFKEMVMSRCAEAQAAAMIAMMYPENSQAATDLAANREQAVLLNRFLDMLDDFEKNEDQWFKTRIEVSR